MRKYALCLILICMLFLSGCSDFVSPMEKVSLYSKKSEALSYYKDKYELKNVKIDNAHFYESVRHYVNFSDYTSIDTNTYIYELSDGYQIYYDKEKDKFYDTQQVEQIKQDYYDNVLLPIFNKLNMKYYLYLYGDIKEDFEFYIYENGNKFCCFNEFYNGNFDEFSQFVDFDIRCIPNIYFLVRNDLDISQFKNIYETELKDKLELSEIEIYGIYDENDVGAYDGKIINFAFKVDTKHQYYEYNLVHYDSFNLGFYTKDNKVGITDIKIQNVTDKLSEFNAYYVQNYKYAGNGLDTNGKLYRVSFDFKPETIRRFLECKNYANIAYISEGDDGLKYYCCTSENILSVYMEDSVFYVFVW